MTLDELIEIRDYHKKNYDSGTYAVEYLQTALLAEIAMRIESLRESIENLHAAE